MIPGSKFPKRCGRWGREEGNFPLSEGIFFCGSALKRDYITGIVASEPSAFIHWPMYGGLSDPHKERAFQQFSKQEVWTQYSHLITIKLIDPVSEKKTLARKIKTLAGKLSSNHLTCDDELSNTGQTHHSFTTHGASSFYCVKHLSHIHMTHFLSVEVWSTRPCCWHFMFVHQIIQGHYRRSV